MSKIKGATWKKPASREAAVGSPGGLQPEGRDGGGERRGSRETEAEKGWILEILRRKTAGTGVGLGWKRVEESLREQEEQG